MRQEEGFKFCLDTRSKKTLPCLLYSNTLAVAFNVSRSYFETMWGWDSHSWNGDNSKFDCKGQNTSHWNILYIIGKLLKCRYPKWAHVTHLDICNTSYGQKKNRESNWQVDSRPQEVRNRPDSLAWRWRVTCRWKALDKGYNFGLNLISIKGLHKKL
jgi:hypothetical protein